MYEVDICAMCPDGGTILAQVTHATSESIVRDKVARLAPFAGEHTRLFFFGPKAALVPLPGVTCAAIEDVFDAMVQRNRRFVERMIMGA
jgi:hypothetical protein